jgi:hypothetical protein
VKTKNPTDWKLLAQRRWRKIRWLEAQLIEARIATISALTERNDARARVEELEKLADDLTCGGMLR